MSAAVSNPFEVFASAQAQRSEEYGQAEASSRGEAAEPARKSAAYRVSSLPKHKASVVDEEDAGLAKLNIMVTPQQKHALKQRVLDTNASASSIIRSLLAREMREWNA